MSKLKEYKFYAKICGGYADGLIKVKAVSYSEAYDKALDHVGRKLFGAFPELDIDYDVEIAEEDENEEE